jgi:YVTN family beta-propeller protein
MNVSSLLRRPLRRAAILAAALALTVGVTAVAALARHEHAGPQANGTAITPVAWRVTPIGSRLELGERPYGVALSPSGQTLLISNDGVFDQSLMAVDTGNVAITDTLHYPAPQALFLGVAFAPDGSHAYASSGSNNLVRTYTMFAGHPVEGAPIPLSTSNGDPFPAGLAVSGDGQRLYVADNLTNALSVIDLPSGHETVVPIASTTCVIGAWGDTSNGHDCAFPYTVALSRDGGTAYVSNWGFDKVSVVNTHTLSLTGQIHVGTHPSALAASPTRDELYVANTDSDSISVIDTTTNTVTRTISLSPYDGAPVGTNPDALAVSTDGGTLYVANSGNNDVAVVRLGGGSGQGAVAGLIPTGWYPTGVAVNPSGSKLYVVSAKGLGAGPNPDGPVPTRDPESSPDQYIGSMINGMLSTIDVPDADQLANYTRQVAANDGFPRHDEGGGAAAAVLTGRGSPIKHVIYIVNENRTYDQVLGDLGRGNGDPKLTLFGWDVAPNHHELAKRFTTLDNLYAAGEVSDDGWEWSTAANANTLDQKTMPTLYGGRGYFYVGEGGTLAGAPGVNPNHSYIWNELDALQIGYRNYGFWATDVPPVSVYNQPQLDAHTDRNYAGFNMQISDQDRFAEWKHEFDQYVANGNLPTVEFVKFPRDHTCGTNPACPTPQAMVADSDWATGKLVDAVSHSPYWRSTAIFVIEDDAQDGPDHVDAHRTVGHVISPYTQTGRVDSLFYSSVSLLKTMEQILGLAPLTQFDAEANAMWASFTTHPDFAPYDAIKPSQPLNQVNTAQSPLARASARMDFSHEDRAPELLLNEAIWKSVKGAASPMPQPAHSITVGGDR